MSEASTDLPTINLDRQIQRLLPRHFKIIDLLVAGHDIKEIADIVGVSTRSINYMIKSPLVQGELARRRGESTQIDVRAEDAKASRGKAMSILEQAAIKAAATQELLLDSGNDSVRQRACDSILDRVLGKGAKDGTGQAAIINISAESVSLINLALKEISSGLLTPANSSVPGNSQDRQGDVHSPASIGADVA